MARIRFAHLNAAGIQSHLAVAENRPAFKLRSYAYVSIRAEGRNQVGVEMLESRALVLQQCMRLVQTDENFYQYSSLSDFIARNPAHDPRTITLVQMVADGQKVLGVRELVPSPQRCADSLKSTLPIDHRIRTDSAADLQSLKALEVALAKAVAGGSSGSGASIVGVAPQLMGSPAAKARSESRGALAGASPADGKAPPGHSPSSSRKAAGGNRSAKRRTLRLSVSVFGEGVWVIDPPSSESLCSVDNRSAEYPGSSGASRIPEWVS